MSLLRSLLDALDTERDDPALEQARTVDEIYEKIDELDEALDDPSNDLELLANRGARDALLWAVGVDSIDVVTDVDQGGVRR